MAVSLFIHKVFNGLSNTTNTNLSVKKISSQHVIFSEISETDHILMWTRVGKCKLNPSWKNKFM